MRKFKKNSGVSIVIIPPHGRVHDTDILEGEQYAKYVPAFLTEIVENPPETSLEDATPEVTVVEAAATSLAVDSEIPAEPATLDGAPATPKKNKGGRPKKQVADAAPTTEAAEE